MAIATRRPQAAGDSPVIPPASGSLKAWMNIPEASGELRQPADAQEEQLALDHQRVTRLEARRRPHDAVHAHEGAPDALDLDGVGRRAHDELAGRDAVARENVVERVGREQRPRPPLGESGKLLDLLVPTAEKELLQVGEEGDLAHAERLGLRPEDDEREDGNLALLVVRGGGTGGGTLHEGHGHGGFAPW